MLHLALCCEDDVSLLLLWLCNFLAEESFSSPNTYTTSLEVFAPCCTLFLNLKPSLLHAQVVSEPTVVTAKTPMLASAGVDTPRPLRLPTALAPAVKQPSPKVQSKAPAPADAARPVSDLATVAATTINVYDRGDMDAPVGSPSSLPVANVEMMPLIGLEAGPDRSRTFSVKSAHESSVASMASQVLVCV